MTVAPPGVIENRVPVISKDENIEDIRHIYMLESDKVQQQIHRYPTRITQLSKEINQVEHTSMSLKNPWHQQWLMNVHEKVEYTLQLINMCIQENMTKNTQINDTA